GSANPVSSPGSPARAILYAFLANFSIAIAKLIAGVVTASGSMIAEAIHSAADTTNQVLLFVGLRGAAKRPDADHPLGYGKLSYFWSFIVALMLFSMGGVFSVYEGLHKLEAGHELNHAWVGLIVLAVAFCIEGLSLFGCLREINLMRGEKRVSQWIRETRNAELVVVLGEDLAALLGLVLAFGFLLTAWLTGNPAYDALGSISIGVVLIGVALFVAVRIQSLLIGKSAEPALRARIDEAIAAEDGVKEVLNTITLHFGANVMLAAKIRFDDSQSLGEVVDIINRMEQRLKANFPELAWCFIEPDRQD
ncbi:MAG: cation diffusion facilitator family transporter, partial [Pseudomonadales bacterium]|nr:cation diffusion facilitator family transporter [Pseudomonadales bacterium]